MSAHEYAGEPYDVDQTGKRRCGLLEVLVAVAGFAAGYLVVWRTFGPR